MPNRLALETSPYLQQHASNPVDWYPWGEEALALARQTGRPILLSVGYSACHWCHVMAHESFEDPDIAASMNRNFVNIKVDREERPDLDQIYQAAHQMLTQRSGGWPLTMFLTPEGTPFFGGTYFPPTARYNLPSFGELLDHIARVYRERPHDIERQNASLLAALDQTLPRAPAVLPALSPAPLEQALNQLRHSFDVQNGGFGSAPKFPRPTEIELCLRRFAASGDAQALQMAVLSLERMALGGIYDQVGGGFCRYSVDALWAIPHFEKMLYDNGLLLRLYSDAWCATGNPLFKRVVEETAAWVMREMQSPEGGYYSSLDADSEHQEGKFYVWTPLEIAQVLSPEEYAVVAPHYGLERSANFEGSHWHMTVVRHMEEVANTLGQPVHQCEQWLASARAKLFARRELRVRPGRDEKILTSWNALMIQGMARAAYVFERADWLSSARAALDFIRSTLWREGLLLATYKDQKAHLNAYLDDYAFLLAALLEIMQAEFMTDDLRFAQAIADVLLGQFEDSAAGGFFFTSHDHERLIHRPKPAYDGATPSGNGVAAHALQRLHALTQDNRYAQAALGTLRLFATTLAQPAGRAALLMALEEALQPPRLVILQGSSEELAGWRKLLRARYLPHTMQLALADTLTGLPDSLNKPSSGRVNAWVCEGVTCLAPIADLSAFERILGIRH